MENSDFWIPIWAGKWVLWVLITFMQLNQSQTVGSVGEWFYNPKIIICMEVGRLEQALYELFSGNSEKHSFWHFYGVLLLNTWSLLNLCLVVCFRSLCLHILTPLKALKAVIINFFAFYIDYPKKEHIIYTSLRVFHG